MIKKINQVIPSSTQILLSYYCGNMRVNLIANKGVNNEFDNKIKV